MCAIIYCNRSVIDLFKVQVLTVGQLGTMVLCIDYEYAKLFVVRGVDSGRWLNEDTGMCVSASSLAEALGLFFYSVNVDKFGRAFPCLPSQCLGRLNGHFVFTTSGSGLVMENRMLWVHPERFVLVDVIGRLENPLVGYRYDRDRGAWFIMIYNQHGLYLGTLKVEDMDDPVFDNMFGLHKVYPYVNSRFALFRR